VPRLVVKGDSKTLLYVKEDSLTIGATGNTIAHVRIEDISKNHPKLFIIQATIEGHLEISPAFTAQLLFFQRIQRSLLKE